MHLTKPTPPYPPLEVNIRRSDPSRRRLGGEIDGGALFEFEIEHERRLGKGRNCGFWMRICGITTSFTVISDVLLAGEIYGEEREI